MILLVSLEVAKKHLHIVDDDHDQDLDIELKLAVASEMVLRYRKLEAVPEEWLDGSPPEIMTPYREQGVCLAILGELFEGREAATINAEALDKLLLILDRRFTVA